MKSSKLLSFLVLFALPVGSYGQAAGGPAVPAPPTEPAEDLRTRNSMSQSEVKHLAEQIEQWKRMDGTGVPPRLVKARVTTMLRALKVNCVVSDAAYRGPGPVDVAQEIYEATCEDGMGYLLMLQGSELKGLSCLAAGGDESQVKCALPLNADGKVVAGKLLSRNQVDCTVRDMKWLGTSAAGLDHVEVTCEGGAGYVLRSPRLGASGELQVLSCQEAIKNGVACELSHSGSASASSSGVDSRPSLAWFKDALSRNGVHCENRRARIVGREQLKRRYLVEFECADRPDGLVAFVPSAGDTVNSFESMDCASAAARGVRCEWGSTDKSPAVSEVKH